MARPGKESMDRVTLRIVEMYGRLRIGHAALAALRAHPLGRDAALVGRVTADHPSRVVLRTLLGARRILDMLVGEQLPRIC